MSTNPFKENNGLFSKNGGVFEVFTPPNKITISENRLITKVFLAGTIDMGDSENWQEKFIQKLKEQTENGFFKNLIIFITQEEKIGMKNGFKLLKILNFFNK